MVGRVVGSLMRRMAGRVMGGFEGRWLDCGGMRERLVVNDTKREVGGTERDMQR